MVFPLRKVIDFAMTKPAEVDEAYRQFFGLLPFSELKPQWEQLFIEWLIFDYKPPIKTSFLIEYTLRNPDHLDRSTLNQFEQIVKTQLYSQFEIFKIKRGLWIYVEDLFSGKTYKVYDKKASESVPAKGIIPGRIAKVDNMWYLVGANSIYFPITYTERARRHMRKLKMKNFSPRDTVELLRSQEKPQRASVSIPTKKELEEKRKGLKEKYTDIAKKFNMTFSFDDLIEEIYKEERVNVLDFWKDLEKKGLKQKMLMEDVQLFQDMWNYFPHKCLNNLSPIEVFSKYSKKGSK